MTEQQRPVLEITDPCPACRAATLDEDPDRPQPRRHECTETGR